MDPKLPHFRLSHCTWLVREVPPLLPGQALSLPTDPSPRLASGDAKGKESGTLLTADGVGAALLERLRMRRRRPSFMSHLCRVELPLIFVNNRKCPETNENKLQHARHEKGRRQTGLFSTKHFICSGLTLAGELGFEPRLTESESAGLPLNYSPTGRST